MAKRELPFDPSDSAEAVRARPHRSPPSSASSHQAPVIIKARQVARIARGGGVVTLPLVTRVAVAGARFTTGFSVYPPGAAARRHKHNCDEQVTILVGRAEVEIDGVVTSLAHHDSTYIPAGLTHSFRNAGNGDMTMMWIYSASRVTRTMADTGEVVQHLSARDRIA